MDFTCVRCGGRVQDGLCENCHEVYMTVCPRCGNTLTFEQVIVNGRLMLRCTACENDTNLQMVAVHPLV